MFHSLNRNPIRFQSFTPFPHLLPLFLGDEVWIHFGDIVLPGCSLELRSFKVRKWNCTEKT